MQVQQQPPQGYGQPSMPNMQQMPANPSMQHAQQSAGKINPAAMPSMVAWREADAQRHAEHQQPWCSSSLGESMPPLPLTPASLLDDGNS